MLTIPPRCNFWITSVSGEYDDQMLSRQLNLQVDDSTQQDKRVAGNFLERAAAGLEDEPETVDVLICREMLRILKKRDPVFVKIPYAKRINWRDFKNRRNLSFFLDILMAHTAITQLQRVVEVDGKLLANNEDFERAKTLWKQISPQQVTQFNKNEMAAFQTFVDKWRDGKAEISRSDLGKMMKWDSYKVTRIMDGRRQPDGSYVGGLCNKIYGFEKIRILSSEESTIRRKEIVVYSYSGPTDILTLYEDVVTLEDEDVNYDSYDS